MLWLVEPTNFIGAGEQHIIEQLKKVNTPVILILNKVDTVDKEKAVSYTHLIGFIPTARIQAAIRRIFLSLRMKPIWTSITSIIIHPIHTFICMVIWMWSRDLSGWIRKI